MKTRPTISATIAASGLLLAPFLAPAFARQDPSPATTTTTAPTTQRAPYRVTIPPGFVRLTADGAFWPRVVLCNQIEADWIKAAMSPPGPATRPTTMPTDLLVATKQKRDTLIARIADDLAAPDPSLIATQVDQKILALAQKLAEMQPSLIFIVADTDELRDAVRGGWANREFDYNRAANVPVFRGGHLDLALDRPGDDTLFPVFFDPSSPQADRIKKINSAIRSDESAAAASVSDRSLALVQSRLAALAADVLNPIVKPQPDQQWFYVGLVSDCSARWIALITGSDADAMIHILARPDRYNPVRAAALDLLHPPELKNLRPGAVQPYEDAFRRRALALFDDWLRQSGPQGLHKTIAALRANPPADGPALLKTIKDVTKIDLTPALAPQE
jgi:hypothetical protein